jgi:cytochrome c5
MQMRAPRFTSNASLITLVLAAVAALSACKPSTTADLSPEAVATRIQKVGSVDLATVGGEAKSGEDVFKAQCSACHASGALGSPKFGDAAAWGPRIGKGYEALLTSALKGKGSMSAQGGGAFTDFEIGRAVVYMVNNSGGKMAEPTAKP